MLRKADIILFLHCRKLFLELNLGFGRRQFEIKRIDFIINFNILLLIRYILFGANKILEKNIICLSI